MTPHIEAPLGSIAKTVLMPGDPLRAKYIAENYLSDYKLVNSVRNIYAYTGTYNGKEVTIMASGMGMPSIGIYSYELYKFYDVDNIIRIGSAGAYSEELKLYDVMLALDAYSESSFAKVQSGEEANILSSSSRLNEMIKAVATELDQKILAGRLHSSDVFYKTNDNFQELYDRYGCLACEMESSALFNTDKILNKEAACLVTISDHFITGEKATSEERETSFDAMIKLALLVASRL